MLYANDMKVIAKMIAESVEKSARFSQRKIGDMPTDTQQLTPRGYVNLNGTRAKRPVTPTAGQQYFSTQDGYPWFTDGVTNWVSATGSVVSAI